MKVKELIEILKALDQDKDIKAEYDGETYEFKGKAELFHSADDEWYELT